MKKIGGATVCYIISVLLVIGFAVNTLIDYSRYNATLNSAPFSLWIWVNAICYLLPGAIALVIGLVIGKRRKANKEKE